MDHRNITPHIIAVIPAFNEEAYIGSVVLKTLEYVSCVIVVDDGSSDATAVIAQRAGAHVISHVKNQGKGMALNTGFEAARSMSPTVVVTIDGDWQHLPEELLRVAEPVKQGEADLVIGSRYIEHTSDVPAQRVLGHWWFTNFTNVLSGTNVTDSQSGYRAFSLKAISELRFSSSSFSVESEMQFLARDLNLRVSEVPITIRYHTQPKRSVLSHGMIVLNGILRLVAQHRPLLFFGVPGVISTLIGFFLALHVVYVYDSTKELAMGTALVVMLTVIIGTFLFFTSIILYSIRVLLDDIAVRKSGSVSIETVHLTPIQES